MALATIARAFYVLLAGLSDRTQRDARRMWAELDPGALDESWTDARIGERLFVGVGNAQLAAAEAATPYVAAALREQGASSAAEGALRAQSLAGIASDGRDLETLLFEPIIRTKTAIRDGEMPERAMEIGESSLLTITGTQVADMGRSAVDVAMTVQPAVTGWVRVLNPPSCGRCAVLAGRRYRSEEIGNFDRHPGCDCTAVPAVEDTADDLRTDPQAYFDSLSEADQDKYFTKSGAQAIRDGADIGQVVNARRGARGLSQPGRLTEAEQRVLREGRDRGRLRRVDVYGRQVLVTTEGTTRRGLAGQRLIATAGETALRTQEERRADRVRGDTGRRARRAKTPRLMPESIYELAGDDRDEAVRLLRRFGYVL